MAWSNSTGGLGAGCSNESRRTTGTSQVRGRQQGQGRAREQPQSHSQGSQAVQAPPTTSSRRHPGRPMRRGFPTPPRCAALPMQGALWLHPPWAAECPLAWRCCRPPGSHTPAPQQAQRGTAALTGGPAKHALHQHSNSVVSTSCLPCIPVAVVHPLNPSQRGPACSMRPARCPAPLPSTHPLTRAQEAHAHCHVLGAEPAAHSHEQHIPADSPAPTFGRKVLNPRMSSGWPLNRSFTFSITPAVSMELALNCFMISRKES